MIVEQVKRLLMENSSKKNMLIQEQIHYLGELEKKGLISPSIPQTFYKYPPSILLNYSIEKKEHK